MSQVLEMDQEYFSPSEVQRRFSMSQASFYRYLSEGKIEAIKIGKKTRVSAQSIRNFYQSCPKRKAGEWKGKRKE